MSFFGAPRVLAFLRGPSFAAPKPSFFFLSLLVLPASMASARNGQTNLWLAAIWAHAWLASEKGRAGEAVAWFYLGLTCKPLGIAPLLLAWVVYPQVRVPSAFAAPPYLLLPFVHPDPGYVAREYGRFWETLLGAGNPGGGDFTNLESLFARFGLLPGHFPGLPVAVLAGGMLACLTYLRRQRVRPPLGPIWFLGTAGAYVLLFNPRTEENSYVILALPMAIYTLLLAKQGNFSGALLLSLGCLLLGIESYGLALYPLAKGWCKPLIGLGFFGWLWSGKGLPTEGAAAWHGGLCAKGKDPLGL
jgi:alpha-1,2-mannosyltransferase